MGTTVFDRLKDMKFGALFALLSLLYGFGLGGVFGAAEDSIKGHLKSQAEAVFDTTYQSDAAKMAAVTSKSWSYFKRAHLHANGLGTAALAMILLLACLPDTGRMGWVAAALLGVGALGYSSFWMFAGLTAPGLGSTGAAKDALEWLAIPTSGSCIAGLVATLYLFVKATFTSAAPRA